MVPKLSPAHRGLFVCAKLDPMLKLTLRYIEGHFIVTGPDIPPMQFKSRAEARDWCKANYPGSPIHEVGEGARKGQLDRRRRRPRTSPPTAN